MRLKDKSVIASTLIFTYVLLAVVIFSCKPEDTFKDPTDYELYINISADQYPAISQDGNLIAYYHKCLDNPPSEDYPTGLYIINIDGTNRRLLLKGDHWNPSFSPDSKWLVFTSDGTLQIINLTGDNIKTFQGVNGVPLYFPDWAPDGKSILFSSPYVAGGGFFTCSPDFQKVTQLFNLYEFSGSNPNWSPDGKSILYCKYFSNNEEIFVIDTAGTTDTRLTNNNRTDRYPSWSPDGLWIAWSSRMEIYVMNSNGNNQYRCDYGRFPAWTPDSKYIIYSNANEDYSKEVLFRIDNGGKNRIQITF